MATKQCQWRDGCNEEAVKRERFCKVHRVVMLRIMEDDGYLEPIPRPEKCRHRPDERANFSDMG